MRSVCAAALLLSFSACGSDNASLFSEIDSATEEPPTSSPPADDVTNEPEQDPPPVTVKEPDDTDDTDKTDGPGEEVPPNLPIDDDDDDDDDGSEDQDPPKVIPPVEPPPEEPPNPRVVSVFPENGATAVSNDTPIIIEFSAPMNRELTERAYQSEGIPSSGVTFVWSEDSTVLTILPDAPLQYASGTDPASVPARRLSYFLSSSAEDVDGNSLAGPQEFSFSLLRQIEATFFAVQDRNLTGNFRSNNTYGTGDCGRNAENMCVGDQREGGNNRQYKGFITFDLESLPIESMVALSEARLNVQITGTSGNPFGGLGDLFLEHTSFDIIGEAAFEAAPRANMGAIANAGNAGTMMSANVLGAVELDVNENLLSQYRFTFEEDTDDDFNADAILSSWETQTLNVKYLIP